MLYEDLQYLSVSAVGLAGIAGLLMLSMWLLDKLYRRVVTWRRRKQKRGKAERLRRREREPNRFPELIFFPLNSAENDATELQPL